MNTIEGNLIKRKFSRMVIHDLRYFLIASISARRGWAIRHRAFECLFFVENRGPGVIEVKPKGVASRQLTPSRSLIDDARQEVLIDVVAGESADLILQPVCGGTDGLSEDVIAYFAHMNEYGYYRKYL
jgi:hypothetical protein